MPISSAIEKLLVAWACAAVGRNIRRPASRANPGWILFSMPAILSCSLEFALRWLSGDHRTKSELCCCDQTDCNESLDSGSLVSCLPIKPVELDTQGRRQNER